MSQRASFQPGFQRITVDQAAGELGPGGPDDAEPLLLDVRERPELVAQRIPGAAWLPMSGFVPAFERLPRDRRLLVICAHGNRSLTVADFLARSGFPDVASVDGGTTAWAAAGLPTVSGPLLADEGALPG